MLTYTEHSVVGTLAGEHITPVGAQSATNGYVISGNPSVTSVETFPFAAPFTGSFTSTVVGDIAEARYRTAAISDNTDAYVLPGSNPSNTLAIHRFPFAAPFTTSVSVGNITSAAIGFSRMGGWSST